MRARFPWGLTLVCALAFLLLGALGVWQVQRLQWKNALVASLEAARTAEARPLDAVLAEAARGVDIEHRRVVVDCPGLATAPHVELTAIVGGGTGVRVISPCLTGTVDYRFLLDRGFVSDEDTGPLGAVPAGRTVTRVTGVLRRPDDDSWFTLDRELRDGPPLFYARQAAIADEFDLPGDAAPWFIIAETSTNPEWAALRPISLPPSVSNNHLGYAATWFGLALALAGFYIALLRRKLRS